MKRQWTRGEKLLCYAPLLFIVAGIAVTVGPQMANKAMGWPTAHLKVDRSDHLYCLSLAGKGSVVATSGVTDGRKSRPGVGQIYFWDARTLQPLGRWDLSTGTGRARGVPWTGSLSLSPDGKLVSYGRSNVFGVYEMATQRPLWKRTGQFLLGTASFSPDGKVVGVSQDTSPGVEYDIFDSQTGKPLAQWKCRPFYGDEAYLAFSRDGSLVATVGPRKKGPFQNYPGHLSDGRNVEIRQLPTAKLVRTLPTNWAKQFTFSPDGSSIAVMAEGVRPPQNGSSGDKIALYSLATGKEIWSYGTGTTAQAPQVFLRAVAFSPDGKWVAAYQNNRPSQILLFDAQTGKVVRYLRLQAQVTNIIRPEALTFAPDGKRLFARGYDEILVWDLD